MLEEEMTTRMAPLNAAIVPKLVAIAVAVLMAPPFVYFASLMGGSLGLTAARVVVALHDETYPFLFGSILGVTVPVLVTGFVAAVGCTRNVGVVEAERLS